MGHYATPPLLWHCFLSRFVLLTERLEQAEEPDSDRNPEKKLPNSNIQFHFISLKTPFSSAVIVVIYKHAGIITNFSQLKRAIFFLMLSFLLKR